MKYFVFACLLSFVSHSASAVSVKTKYSVTPTHYSYIFNAGQCVFESGESLDCQSDKAKLKLQRLMNIAVTNVLAEIRDECTWFDILDVESETESKNKRQLIDQAGFALGDYVEKHFKAKVRYLCEEPIS